MLQIAIAGIVTVLIALQFRNQRSEYEILLCLAGGLLIMTFSVGKLTTILRGLRQMESYISLKDSYYGILLKIIGITYLSEFASDICKDTGHASVGNYIELAGKLSIMTISMPILLALLDTLQMFQ